MLKEKLKKKDKESKAQFVQTKIKLRSRWTAPIKYKVLQTFQLNDKDRKEVIKHLVLAVTPDKAKRLVYGRQGWSYRDISLVKDFECGVLQFKGLAVCLFYKRQCNEIEPVASDPVPIGSLESDDDVWARLDLFSKSPRQIVGEVREELLELSMQVSELTALVDAKEHLILRKDREIRELMDKNKELSVNVKKLQSRYAATFGTRFGVIRELSLSTDSTTKKEKGNEERNKGIKVSHRRRDRQKAEKAK